MRPVDHQTIDSASPIGHDFAMAKKSSFSKYIVISVIALVILYAIDSRFQIVHPLVRSRLTKQVEEKIEHAVRDHTAVDLRDLQGLNWDEVYLIEPYGTIGEGTPDYEGPLLESDETEVTFVFLLKNKYQGHVVVPRTVVDFAECRRRQCSTGDGQAAATPDCACPTRIQKKETVFEIGFNKDSFRSVTIE